MIDVAASALLTLDNGTAITNGAAGNSETVEGTLTLQDTSSITAGTVTVSNTGKLNLQGTATLKNGTLTNGNQVNVTGTGNTLDHGDRQQQRHARRCSGHAAGGWTTAVQ